MYAHKLVAQALKEQMDEKDATIASLLEALKRAKGIVEYVAGSIDSDPEDHELLETVNKAIKEAT